MKSRWFSRGAVLSVALFASLGAVACSQAQGARSDASNKPAVAAESGAAQHGPGQRMFRQIEALDLTADQRDEISDIQARLQADLTTHRASLRQAGEMLADGIEAGSLDTREATARQEALATAAKEASVSVERAMNEVHDILDADQREELVRSLRAQREQMSAQREQMRAGAAGEGSERQRDGFARFAERLGLSSTQKVTLQGEIQAQIDKVFPDRKARREAWDAKMNAMGDAFVTDDFHAEDFDLGAEATAAVASFTGVARQAIELSNGALDPTQRMIAASLLRSHVAKMQ